MLRLLGVWLLFVYLQSVCGHFEDVYANEHYQIRHRRVRYEEQHPQIRNKQYQLSLAYRSQCYSCMSPYLEDQFVYISHLYRKPLSFTEKCDRQTFDWRHVKLKNCTDLCVTIRMNDKIAGRRRNGYMRGCMSDIKYYNRSVLYYGDVVRTGHTPQHTRCQMVRLRDLFAAPDWYGFDSTDQVEMCTCQTPMCNSAPDKRLSLGCLLLLPTLILTISAFGQLFPTRRKNC